MSNPVLAFPSLKFESIQWIQLEDNHDPLPMWIQTGFLVHLNPQIQRRKDIAE
jgi:hypothetical protein